MGSKKHNQSTEYFCRPFERSIGELRGEIMPKYWYYILYSVIVKGKYMKEY